MAGIGSGLGGYVAVVNGGNQSSGTQGYAGSQFEVPTRFVPVKSAKGTYDPHIVQGGPYVRKGQVVDVGSANVAVYLDAKGTMVGDFMNTSMALLLAQAMGGYGTGYTGVQGSQLGIQTSTAYALCAGAGTVGTQYAALQVQDGFWFDMEIAVPTTQGGLQYQDYHSNKITKAEWTFPRNNIVSYAYDWDSAYVTLSSSATASGAEPGNPVPFTMPNSSSLMQVIPNSGSQTPVNIDGVRKVTVTTTPKLATDRIYVGNQYKEEPVTNGLIEVAVALEMDYTPTALSNIFGLFAAHEPLVSNAGSGAQAIAAPGLLVQAVGNEIGSSGVNDTFGFFFPMLWLMSGGEAPLEGVDIIKNTIMLKGTINAFANNAQYAILYTADTGP